MSRLRLTGMAYGEDRVPDDRAPEWFRTEAWVDLTFEDGRSRLVERKTLDEARGFVIGEDYETGVRI